MNQIWARYADDRYIALLRALRVRIVLSRAALWSEILAQRLWGVGTLALFSYAFVAFGGLGVLSPNVALSLSAAVMLLGLFLLVVGLREIRIPDKNAAIDRLDVGRALASLRDHPATGTKGPMTRALWQAHQDEMAAQAARLQVVVPDLRLSNFDRNGLRLMALVSAAAALFFAPEGALTAASNGLSLPVFTQQSEAVVEAWATPPAYTGKGQVYLNDVRDGVILDLPVGTQIVMQVYGGADDVMLEQNISDVAVILSGDKTTVRNATVVIENSGEVEVHDGGAVLKAWRIIAKADNPPNIAITQDIEQTTSGAMKLPFTATDDYGIIAGIARIHLDLAQVDRRFGLTVEPAARAPLETSLPMLFRGKKDTISEVFIENFSKDVWAGLPVVVMFEVTDGAGQTGVSKVPGILPGKQFFMPLAAAFAEQRRDLLWSPTNDVRVLQVLKAVTYLPEDLMLSAGTYLRVRSAVRRLDNMLEDGLSAEERQEITEELWQLAMFLEEGDMADARERLRRAQEKLMNAIEQGAEQEEIANLLEELREATDEFLEMLADEKAPEPADSQQTLGSDQLQQMLDTLQQLAENGETEAARELLEAMRQMMEELQLAEQDGAGNAEEIEQMRDALEQQQSLSDETFQQLQQQLEDGIDAPNPQSLADQQDALRELLDELRGQSDSTQELTEGASNNMEVARDHLQDGELGQALNEQAEALENLRETIRKLGEEMQQAGQGRNGLQEGDTQDSPAENDPLGRPLGRTGTTESGETLVPDQNASERARELLDEIRRRSGDLERPEAEIEYLKRLLERF